MSDNNDDIVKKTLENICLDEDAPAAARASAARTLAEMQGRIGRNATPEGMNSKPIQEMTAEELQAELSK